MKHQRDSYKWITIALWWIIFLQYASAQFDETFTLQNVWGRLQPGMRSLIQCLNDENHKKIKFSRALDTGQGTRLPPSSQQFLQGKPVFARILFMPEQDEMNRFGVFQCKFAKKNIETKIVALKLPPANLVELDAISPYNVANLGEDVELEVNVTQKLELPVKWMHNGKEVPEWDGLLTVQLTDVQPKNAGIYECFYDGRRGEGVHALMRLIVRSCPEDLYGENCDKECPPCYNGGICHDKWGVCVCPAGFAGVNCETPCGGNHFGADCNKFCSPPQNNSNTDELCALHLFCKPDPYGCSCAPGFKGSKCMEHCEPGWYGADCKQPCHCAYGSSNCNRITGACDGGCARGWRGHSCQIEDADSNNTYIETTTMSYCTPGTYGPSCERFCHCAANEHCHIVTGQCPSGCEDGWGGPTCGNCRSGRFGENCESTCHCEGGHHNCDKDGFCYSGCEAGWAGFTCQAECASGRFGPNCASTCHCHENSSAPCDKVTGECPGDCEAGYMGKDCQTLCPPNTYGVNCVNKCVCYNLAQCNRVDGSCACDGRWRGRICNESEPQIVAATDEEGNAGQNAFLSCTADAVPAPQMNITYSDFPGIASRVSIRDLEQNQQQAVIKVKPEKSGVYDFLCTARNEHGFDMKKITLTVVDPPRLTSPPILEDKSNTSLTVTWKSWEYSTDEGGIPTDRVDYLVLYRQKGFHEWIKLGTWKTPLTGHFEPEVTIEDLTPNTVYEVSIKCRRKGEGGTGDPGPILEAKTECGVALPDGIPQEFLPEKITQTTVALTWKNPPESLLQCPLTSYRLTYYPEAFESIMETIETDGVQTSIVIEDLTPHKNYVVRLYPVTKVEESKYYAELIIKTSETVPGPVSDLEINLVDDKPDLLLVSWEAPSEEFGAIKGYVVTTILLDRGQCGGPKELEELSTRQIHSDDTEITLQNLYPYSVYNISVQAKTMAGVGEPVSKKATTLESVPSEAPPNVRVISSSNDSLEFAWDPVPCKHANGDIIYYEYTIVQNVETPVGGTIRKRKSLENIFDPVPDLQVKISNLKPFTSYGFMVAGVTGVGRGLLSDIVSHKTEEGVPSEPRLLSTTSVTEKEMEISWTEPEYPNGIIIQYHVTVWTEDFSKKVFKTETRAEFADISGLKPATQYIIQVNAETKAGWGSPAELSERTLDGAPGEPSQISVTESLQTSMNVSWKEPLESNGVIVGYKVRYQPLSTLDPVFNNTPFITKEIDIEGNQTEIVLTHLHPSTQYSIHVTGKTSAGYGPPASIISWTVISGDHVSPSLRMIEIDATNETIPIVFSTTGSNSVYKYQVIVEDARNNVPIDESLLSDFDTAVVQKGLPYYIAAELDPSNVSQTGEQTFVVGDKQIWGGYKNVHLNPGYEYKIRIRTLVVKDEDIKSVLSKPENKTAGTMVLRMDRPKRKIFGIDLLLFILILIGSLVVLTAVTFLTILAICYRRDRKQSTNSFSTKDSGLSGSMTWSVMYKVPNILPEIDETPLPEGFRTLPMTEKHASLKRSKSDSKIVRGLRVETLEDYLTNAKSSNLLAEEFKRLVDGQISSWTVARKSGNLKKNRYGNILPYDRYRVVLNTDSNKADNDYINASYIDGYRRPREYIVTQGPLDNTVVDFWRMVWQENSPVIVMLMELVENGKKKCAKYWPDDSMDCGDMHILLIHSEQYKDFVVRTILMRKIDEIRTHRVIQYQYTGWPDQTVPLNVNSLIKFLKKIRDDHPVMGGPMVVHCSAGAGRSGTYIAIDALCQQAAEDKRVDVFRFVNNARHQRVHLVQTLEQYAFIYEALVEALQFEDTTVPLEKIGNYLKELNHINTVDRRSLILKQYNKLNKSQKKVDVSRCSVALSEINIFKNRDPLTVPRDTARIVLESEDDDDERSDYINAVYVDGYLKPAQFIATQMPMTHTAEDFWRLIYQQRSSFILMLNGSDENDDLNVGIYWPELGECSFGDIEVQLVTFEEQGPFTVRIMRLSHKYKEEEPLKIIQLQYNGWTSEMKPASVVTLVQTVEMWYQRSAGGPITVHCMDGATRTGLFIAATHVCDQVESEGILDVYQIVKSIRTNRPEFIPNSDQYRILFEVAQEVAEPYLVQLEQQQSTKKLSMKI
ncbi:receptor-type tyrosine-protein phosphatase mu-like isoform X2 [Argiope bruennichi]|uniref:receptor-type tyrosine-protein phosphatase mu-like isoform X2 n=1 Tax=Argiope bruennichi TaxID=94029 RepID=UPI0024956CC4|nr:receptor-type tyrosine-protein phosphatase mu-like isoform X2 [Argiope bruennichi]